MLPSWIRKRSLRWFVALAVLISCLLVFLGTTLISSLLYERLLTEQATYYQQQLDSVVPQAQMPPQGISKQIRITYIASFLALSLLLIVGVVWIIRRAARHIEHSLTQFNQRIQMIRSSQDLVQFSQEKPDFLFSEFNQVFNSVNQLADQLQQVLIDRSVLEIRSALLKCMVIHNDRIHHWEESTREMLGEIAHYLPFQYCNVAFVNDGCVELNTFWIGMPTKYTRDRCSFAMLGNLRRLLLKGDQALARLPVVQRQYFLSQERSDWLPDDFIFHSDNTALNLLDKPRIGGVLGLSIHATSLHRNPSMRLAVESLLMPLMNFLGTTRLISNYTRQLESSISSSQRENDMAADMLYSHLINKHAYCPPGINYDIRSSGTFSGDIILVKRSPSGSIFLLMADATGHGLTAAVSIMPIISVFEAMVNKGHDLSTILIEMNQRLARDLPDDRFVAATLIELDLIHREAGIWNGGMPPVLLLDETSEIVQEYRSRHMALGILPRETFDATPARFSLPSQGYLFAYSDGLSEQVDAAGNSFGNSLVWSLLQQQPDNPIPLLSEAVQQHTAKGQIDDDISLVHVDFALLQQQPARPSPAAPTRSLVLPFVWQIRLQGNQLVKQPLPSLCHDFLNTLTLSTELKEHAYAAVYELTQLLLHQQLLDLPPRPSGEDTAALQAWYQLRTERMAQLPPDVALQLHLEGQVDATHSYLQLSVTDNRTEDFRLLESQAQALLAPYGNSIRLHAEANQLQARIYDAH